MQNSRQVYKGDGFALKEVTITGKKTVKGSRNLNGPGGADQVITGAELVKAGKKTLYDLLVEKVPGFGYRTPRKSENLEFFLGNNQLRIIIDGMNVDSFYEPMPVRNHHFDYIRDYLTRYTAEDVAGIEVMGSLYNTTNYDGLFAEDALARNAKGDYLSYLEITTHSGSGPFLRKSANIYLYKPLVYGDLKVFYSPKYTSATKGNEKPDLRSTIYWVPNLVTNRNGEVRTSFFSADKKGSYTVWIEGTDMQGHIGMKAVTLKIE
ncbi:hypothetical protein D9M68_725240 [compost metagenome]